MYKLTLTHDERRAIDWVGYRYSHGTEFYRLLCKCDWTTKKPDYIPDDCDIEWDSEEDITFHVPEHIAWEIRELFQEEDYSFSCLSEEFAEKLMRFCDAIV